MNEKVINNYSKIKPTFFIVPILFLIIIFINLYVKDSLSIGKYVENQKEHFYMLNSLLSQFPYIDNFNELGDALIFSSLISMFIIYAPKIWESLFSAFIISFLASVLLKKMFAIPRPAAALEHDSFVIIGRALFGNNSMPSGHAITVFTVLTIIFFAFTPQRSNYRIIWSLLTIVVGAIIGFARVGVGAHYPLDVVIGGILGYLIGLCGIYISQKTKIWLWINYRKNYPIFILIFFLCCILVIRKILEESLIIFYIALICLLFSLYKITSLYAKK